MPESSALSARLTMRPSRTFRLVVPEEWYRRSRHRSLSASPFEERDEDDISEIDADNEEDGTAKATGHGIRSTMQVSQTSISASQTPSKSPSKGGAPSRLSSIFDTWRGSPSPTTPRVDLHERRISVSDPVLLGTNVDAELRSRESLSLNDEEEEGYASEFERLMDEMGLKGQQRAQTSALPLDSKRYLIAQNRMHKSTSTLAVENDSQRSPQYSASYGPSSAAALIPKIVPQLTGDVMKRLSLANLGWGNVSSPTSSDDTGPLHPLAGSLTSIREEKGNRVEARSGERELSGNGHIAQPLVPQTTGSLWGSWWATPATPASTIPPEKAAGLSRDPKKPKSCAWYVDQLRPRVLSGTPLAKHLISLRVHLSTAKLAWIENFIKEEKGMDALGQVLADLVGKGSKRPKLTEADNINLGEVLKCFRVLLNTEVSNME